MLESATKFIHSLDSGKPSSSVSQWIDILSSPRYEEDDYEGIPELVESINLQSTGPTEASRAIRKKLKYSNQHGQLRALTILKALVENCGPRFQTTFANERLVDRIKLMAGDPMTDERVKKKILSVLGSWHRQFKDDPSMKLIAGLYASCGGGQKSSTRNAAHAAFDDQQLRYDQEADERARRKALDRSEKEAERERLAREKEEKKRAKNQPAPATRVKRAPFNFEAEKPKIMACVGQATQSAQNLINALQHVNREQESVTTNLRVVECLTKAKADRKQVVRYIQLVENDVQGDYIGTLLATNEQVLTALSLYDRMAKPAELDSDDEHIEEAKKQATRHGLLVLEADGDTASIRSRLSAFDIQDREVEKLQDKQRYRVEQNNRARALHPDLADLAFGPTPGSSSLPPPIQPSSSDPQYQHGSLSEYSDDDDYSSSDADDHPAHRAPVSHPAATGERSYARYVQQDDERQGKGKGLLAEPEEDDPFADPFNEVGEGGDYDEGYTPDVGQQGKRMNWKEI